MVRRLAALPCALVLVVACAAETSGVKPSEPIATSPEGGAPLGEIELVESAPIETTLDHADIPNAADVWLAMIARAQVSIDIASFYASDSDDPSPKTKLTSVLDAIDDAVGRGVHVRFLADASFAKTYPTTLARLERSGVEVRKLDFGKGEMHAKYFVVDAAEAFLGSQNFDWRALEHIQEIGVRVSGPPVAFLRTVFANDWQAAGGEPADEAAAIENPASLRDADVMLAVSPEKKVPEGMSWDLPLLVERIDRAKERVSVQALTYGTGGSFTTLDDALRRAAERGAAVRVLVSNWSTEPGTTTLTSLQALASVPRVEVRVLTVPQWSGGEIPYARVAHAKYAVFDDDTAWIGTSNWEVQFFELSRNVSLFLERSPIVVRLGQVFDDGWQSRYARPLAKQ